MHYILFIHSSANGHLGCFHFQLWALVYRFLDGDTFLIFLGTRLGVKLLNDYFSNLISLTTRHIPYALVSHSGALFPHPQSILSGPHAFSTLLFPLRSSSLLLFWVQVLCVTKDPAQLSLPPQNLPPTLPLLRVMQPHVCLLIPGLSALDCSYSVPRSYYLPGLTPSHFI